MTLTPRQILAYLDFSQKLDRAELSNELMITAVGSQGDGKTIDKVIKDLTR